MKKTSSLRRFLTAVLVTAVCSAMATSCASSGPKYGCPGSLNQGSRYAH